MGKRIVITGATGLIGMNIAEKLIDRGDSVIVLTRNPEGAREIIPGASEFIRWSYDAVTEECRKTLSEADAVIHLAGENIMAARWNEKHKRKVYESRVEGTKNIVDAIDESNTKPSVFVCASAVGYYDSDSTKEFDEDGQMGSGFLAEVTAGWEDEAKKVEACGVRRVSIRIGVVLDGKQGALAKMLPPYKFFAGGSLGSGRQWLPWIHIDDISNLFIYAVDNDNLSGAYNGVGGNTRMNEFAKAVGRVIKRPAIFKVPSFVLKIVLGEAAVTVLEGSRIIPRRTLSSGYEFIYNQLERALEDAIVS